MNLPELFRKKIEKLKSRTSLHDYGFQLTTFDLPQDGKIEYARWQHPS